MPEPITQTQVGLADSLFGAPVAVSGNNTAEQLFGLPVAPGSETGDGSRRPPGGTPLVSETADGQEALKTPQERAEKILSFWGVLKADQHITVTEKPARQHGKSAKPTEPDYVIRVVSETGESATDWEYDLKTLEANHEKKLENIRQERQAKLDHLNYLWTRNNGQTLEEVGVQLEFTVDTSSQAIVRTPGGRTIDYEEAVQNLDKHKPKFKEAVVNIQRVLEKQIEVTDPGKQRQRRSKTKALEIYINHETRFGRAASQEFEDRAKALEMHDKRQAEYQKNARTTGSKIYGFKAAVSALTRPIEKVTSYASAILRAATAVTVYDWNPLRVLGEKTIGKVWVHEFAEGVSLREGATWLEGKLGNDYITKEKLKTGGISEAKARESFVEAVKWVVNMNLLPQFVSEVGGIFHLQNRPSEIYSLLKSAKMALPRFDAIEKMAALEDKMASGKQKVQSVVNYLTPEFVNTFVHTYQEAESRGEKKWLAFWAAVSAPGFLFAEKVIPHEWAVNPVLMVDVWLMRLVGVTQKFMGERGIVTSKCMRVLEAVESGIFGAFNFDSFGTLGRNIQTFVETGSFNPIAQIKTEAELLTFKEKFSEYLKGEGGGIFGEWQRFEERLMEQVREKISGKTAEKAEPRPTILHLTDDVGVERTYVTQVSENGQLELLRGSDSGTEVYMGGKWINPQTLQNQTNVAESTEGVRLGWTAEERRAEREQVRENIMKTEVIPAVHDYVYFDEAGKNFIFRIDLIAGETIEAKVERLFSGKMNDLETDRDKTRTGQEVRDMPQTELNQVAGVDRVYEAQFYRGLVEKLTGEAKSQGLTYDETLVKSRMVEFLKASLDGTTVQGEAEYRELYDYLFTPGPIVTEKEIVVGSSVNQALSGSGYQIVSNRVVDDNFQTVDGIKVFQIVNGERVERDIPSLKLVLTGDKFVFVKTIEGKPVVTPVIRQEAESHDEIRQEKETLITVSDGGVISSIEGVGADKLKDRVITTTLGEWQTPDHIILHVLGPDEYGNEVSANQAVDVFSQPNTTDAHAIVGKDGTVFQILRFTDSKVEVTTASPTLDEKTSEIVTYQDGSIDIEIEALDGKEVLTRAEQVDAVVKLTLGIMGKYNIPLDKVIGHHQSGLEGVGKVDPGDEFMAEVKHQIEVKMNQQPTVETLPDNGAPITNVLDMKDKEPARLQTGEIYLGKVNPGDYFDGMLKSLLDRTVGYKGDDSPWYQVVKEGLQDRENGDSKFEVRAYKEDGTFRTIITVEGLNSIYANEELVLVDPDGKYTKGYVPDYKPSVVVQPADPGTATAPADPFVVLPAPTVVGFTKEGVTDYYVPPETPTRDVNGYIYVGRIVSGGSLSGLVADRMNIPGEKGDDWSNLMDLVDKGEIKVIEVDPDGNTVREFDKTQYDNVYVGNRIVIVDVDKQLTTVGDYVPPKVVEAAPPEVVETLRAQEKEINTKAQTDLSSVVSQLDQKLNVGVGIINLRDPDHTQLIIGADKEMETESVRSIYLSMLVLKLAESGRIDLDKETSAADAPGVFVKTPRAMIEQTLTNDSPDLDKALTELIRSTTGQEISALLQSEFALTHTNDTTTTTSDVLKVMETLTGGTFLNSEHSQLILDQMNQNSAGGQSVVASEIEFLPGVKVAEQNRVSANHLNAVSVVETEDGRNLVVVVCADNKAGVTATVNQIVDKVVEVYNPQTLEGVDRLNSELGFGMATDQAAQADFKAKFHQDYLEWSQETIKEVQVFADRTSEVKLVDKTGAENVVFLDANQQVITNLDLGDKDGVVFADHRSAIEGMEKSDLFAAPEFESFSGKVNLNLETVMGIDISLYPTHFPSQTSVIQSASKDTYDFLVYVDDDGNPTVAYVHPNSDRTHGALANEVRIGIVPNATTGMIDVAAVDKGVAQLVRQLNESGSISINQIVSESNELGGVVISAKNQLNVGESIKEQVMADQTYKRLEQLVDNFNQTLDRQVVLSDVLEGRGKLLADGADYQEMIYVAEGLSISKESVATHLGVPKESVVLTQSTNDPTMWLVGTKIVDDVTREASFEYSDNKLVYQVREVDETGKEVYKLVTELKGDEEVTSYFALEKPISAMFTSSTLIPWKELGVGTHYFGEALVTPTPGGLFDKQMYYVDPVSMLTYVSSKEGDREVLLPVINAELSLKDIATIKGLSQTDETELSTDTIDKLVDNCWLDEIVYWSHQSGEVIYQEIEGKVVRVSKDVDGSGGVWELAKDEAGMQLVDDQGRLLFASGDGGKFIFNREKSQFEVIEDDGVAALNSLLSDYQPLMSGGDESRPMHWRGLPVLVKDELLYVVSAEGLRLVGSVYTQGEFHFVADVEADKLYEHLGVTGGVVWQPEQSFLSLETNGEKLIHSVAIETNDLVETSRGLTNIRTDKEYGLYKDGSLVDKDGNVVFQEDTGKLMVFKSGTMEVIDQSELQNRNLWLQEKGLEATGLEDRQTRMAILVDTDGKAFVFEGTGLKEVGNLKALRKAGLVGFIDQATNKFETETPETWWENVTSNDYSFEEKAGRVLDPLFENVVRSVFSWIVGVDDAALNIDYLKQAQDQKNYKTFDELPPKLVQAIVASEDETFFDKDEGQEMPVDTRALIRAIVMKMTGGGTSGGSNITMQTAKNLTMSFDERADQNVGRKVSEWVMASVLQDKYAMEDIFAAYVNSAYYAKSEGVVEGSRALFGKEIEDLSLAETAMLTVMPKNPDGQGMWVSQTAERWADNASAVIRRMQENGFISEAERDQAWLEIYEKTQINSDTDINFVKSELHLDDEQSVVFDQLAEEYEKLDFEQRLKVEKTVKTTIIPNGTSPEGLPMQPTVLETEKVEKNYLDFVTYIQENNPDLLVGKDVQKIREQYYETKAWQDKFVGDGGELTDGGDSYLDSFESVGPQFEYSLPKDDGSVDHFQFWKVENGQITISADHLIYQNIEKDDQGEEIVFSPVMNQSESGVEVVVKDRDGNEILRANDGTMWSLTQDGLAHLPQVALTGINASGLESSVELFPVNSREELLLKDNSIKIDSNEKLMKSADGIWYVVTDGKHARLVGQTLDLGDGRQLLYELSHKFFKPTTTQNENDQVIVSTDNALRMVGNNKSIGEVFANITKSSNPFEGYSGNGDDKDGLGANPNAVKDALDNVGVKSQDYTWSQGVNNEGSELLKDLIKSTQTDGKALMVWVDFKNQKDLDIFDASTTNSSKVLVEASKYEYPVVIEKLVETNSGAFVVFRDPNTSDLKELSLDKFIFAASSSKQLPYKALVVGNVENLPTIKEGLAYDYMSPISQLASQFAHKEYTVGENASVDALVTINTNMESFGLASAKETIQRFGSTEFSGLMMDGKGNLIFAGGINKEGKQMNTQEVFDAEYAPGSVFKLVSASYLLTQGLKPDISYKAGDRYMIGPGRYLYNHSDGAPSTMTLSNALKYSNNPFFYAAAMESNPSGFDAYLADIGIGNAAYFNQFTNQHGFVGTNEWALSFPGMGYELSDGHHAYKFIGQGELRVTPLEMLWFTGALANNGEFVQPNMVRGADFPVDKSLPIDNKGLAEILEGMKDVTTESGGTAYTVFKDVKGYTVFGKTGTAQNGDADDKPHSWFVGWAVNNKTGEKIIFSFVFPNSGEGANVAAPYTKKMLDEYFGHREFYAANTELPEGTVSVVKDLPEDKTKDLEEKPTVLPQSDKAVLNSIMATSEPPVKQWDSEEKIVSISNRQVSAAFSLRLDKSSQFNYGEGVAPDGTSELIWNATEAAKRFGSITMSPGDQFSFTQKIGFGDKLTNTEANDTETKHGNGYVVQGSGACFTATVFGELFGLYFEDESGNKVPLFVGDPGWIQEHGEDKYGYYKYLYNGKGVAINESEYGQLPVMLNPDLPDDVKVAISMDVIDTDVVNPEKGVFSPVVNINITNIPEDWKQLHSMRITTNRKPVLEMVTGRSW